MLVVLAFLIALAARVDACPDDEPEAAGPDEVQFVPDVAAPSRGERFQPGEPSVHVSRAQLARIAAAAPPVAEVIAAAYRAAGLAGDPTPGWRWRSRMSALVPMVSVRGGRDDSWTDVEDPTIRHLAVFDVRATWRIERLLFDPTELRIAAVDAARRRERRRIAEEAVHAYYAWLRAAASGPSLRADEATAQLDVLTDQWFSEALARRENLLRPPPACEACEK